MKIFDVKKISYRYDKYDKTAKNVLSDVSFTIDEKDFIAIVGKTGSGKSTLISHLNGLIKADSGDIFYKDKSIYDKDFDLTKLRFDCGVVFQYPEYQLFAETVFDDICFGAIKKGMSKAKAEESAVDIMKMLDIYHLKDESPFNLSGGEKKKAAFAGVYIMNPEVLVLDEPEAGLDPASKNNMFKLLRYLNEEKGKTIVFITHDLDTAAESTNKIILLNDGEIIGEGAPTEVLGDDKLLDKAGLIMPYSISLYKKYDIKNPTSCKFDDVVKSIYDKRHNSRTIL